MVRFLLVCVGGALGSGARYLFSTAATRLLGNFPFGTLGVNLIGSFLISFVTVLAAEKGRIGEDARLFLTTGVMGGFTTYSSFNFETMRLASAGATGLAVVNVGVTLAGCLLAGVAGLWCGRALGT